MNEHELRGRLHTLAEQTAPPHGDARGWALDAARRDRAHRRRSWAAAGAVAATVAAVLVTVLVVSPGSSGRSTAAAATASGSTSVFGPEVRGSLAADTAFLEGVLQLSWAYDSSDVVEPALTDRRVAYAGDVPGGGRWAIVVGTSPGLPEGEVGQAWFAGPEGAGVDQMVLTAQPGPVADDQPQAYLGADSGSLLVIAAPGDTIQVSPRPTFTAAGDSERIWRDEPSTDGTAVTTTNGPMLRAVVFTPVQYRVLRDGAEVISAMPRVWLGPDGRQEPPFDTVFLDVATGAETAGLESAARGLLTDTGLGQGEVTFEVAYSGPADGAQDSRELQVLTVTTPTGAVLVAGQLITGTPDDSVYERCLRQAEPAGTSAQERSYAMICPDLGLVVVTPGGAQNVEVLDNAGVVLSSGRPINDIYTGGTAADVVSVRVTGSDGAIAVSPVGSVQDLFN